MTIAPPPATLAAMARGISDMTPADDPAEIALKHALTMLDRCPYHDRRLSLDHVAALVTESQLVPQLAARLQNASWASVLRSSTCLPHAARRDGSAVAARRAESVQNALLFLSVIFIMLRRVADGDRSRIGRRELREVLDAFLQQASGPITLLTMHEINATGSQTLLPVDAMNRRSEFLASHLCPSNTQLRRHTQRRYDQVLSRLRASGAGYQR